MDEEQLVALGVAVERGHLLSGPRHRDDTLAVVHQRVAALDQIALRRYVRRLQVVVPVDLLRPLALADGAMPRDARHPRRRVLVIEQRVDAAEALLAEQLLAVEAAVRLAELGVPLVRHLAQPDI